MTSEQQQLKRRFVVPAAAVLSYINMLVLGSIVVIINATMERVADVNGISLIRAGLFISAFGFGRLIVLSVSGAMTDKLGRKACVIIGLSIMLLFYVAMPLSRSFALSFSICAVCGLGYGLVNTASMTVINDAFAPYGRNDTGQILVQFMYGSGGIVMPLLASAILRANVEWGALYWGSGAVAVIIIIASSRVSFPPRVTRAAKDNGYASEPTMRREGLILSLISFLVFSMTTVYTTWLPLLASDRIGLATTDSVLTLAFYNIGSITCTLALAFLLRKLAPIKFLIINPVVAILSVTLLLLARNATLFYIAVFVSGASIATIFNLGMGVGGELFSGNAAKMTGMMLIATSSAVLVVPSVTQPIIENEGIAFVFALIYALGACACALSFVLMKRMKRLKEGV